MLISDPYELETNWDSASFVAAAMTSQDLTAEGHFGLLFAQVEWSDGHTQYVEQAGAGSALAVTSQTANVVVTAPGATAPAGSRMDRVSSKTSLIAAQISSVLTVMTPSTSCWQRSKHTSPTCRTATPSPPWSAMRRHDRHLRYFPPYPERATP